MEQKEVKTSVEPEVARGVYANGFVISAQERDLAITFFNDVDYGQEIQRVMVSKVFLNHVVADMLAENIKKTTKDWQDKKYSNPQPFTPPPTIK